MELKDTVKLMESEDFKDRFKAEYYQTKIRYEKLHTMIVKYEAGTLNFEPKCSIELLKEQSATMGKYLYMLEVRAQIENINGSTNNQNDVSGDNNGDTSTDDIEKVLHTSQE